MPSKWMLTRLLLRCACSHAAAAAAAAAAAGRQADVFAEYPKPEQRKEYKGDPINAYLSAHHPHPDNPDPKGAPALPLPR